MSEWSASESRSSVLAGLILSLFDCIVGWFGENKRLRLRWWFHLGSFACVAEVIRPPSEGEDVSVFDTPLNQSLGSPAAGAMRWLVAVLEEISGAWPAGYYG